jgi:hypothetical protein
MLLTIIRLPRCFSLVEFLAVNSTRVADPDPYPDWIRIQSGQWIRIRIQEGKK